MRKRIQYVTKPRDATSVIIIKKNKSNCYVLMGRRPITSRFMPGVYVFPGGAVDKEDYKVSDLIGSKISISRSKLKTRSIRQSNALLFSAIRETAEETGLYLGIKTKTAIKFNNNEKDFWSEVLNKKYFSPNIDGLTFFGRAITPSFLKTRYHARFFIALHENFFGKIETNGELEDLNWINIKETDAINMADVTDFMIKQILRINGNIKKMSKKFSYPMFTWRNKKRWVKWESYND